MLKFVLYRVTHVFFDQEVSYRYILVDQCNILLLTFKILNTVLLYTPIQRYRFDLMHTWSCCFSSLVGGSILKYIILVHVKTILTCFHKFRIIWRIKCLSCSFIIIVHNIPLVKYVSFMANFEIYLHWSLKLTWGPLAIIKIKLRASCPE